MQLNSRSMKKSSPGFRVEDFGLTWDDTIWHVLHPPSLAALQTARVWSYWGRRIIISRD